MNQEDLVSDYVGSFKVGKLFGREEKVINFGKDSYKIFYFCSSLENGTPVVIGLFEKKLLNDGISTKPGYGGRLEEKIKDHKFLQAALLASLFPDNPIIPKVYAQGEDNLLVVNTSGSLGQGEWEIKKNKFVYFVTEPRNPIPLPLEEKTAVDSITKLAYGLQEIHNRDIYHKKINPFNIVGTVENPKLINFNDGGYRKGNDIWTVLERIPEQVLELLCMSPELVENYNVNSSALDIYSLAASLHYLIAGLPDLKKMYPTRIISEKFKKEEFFDRKKIANQKIAEVINKATEKNPAERYQSMAEFSKALENI